MIIIQGGQRPSVPPAANAHESGGLGITLENCPGPNLK